MATTPLPSSCSSLCCQEKKKGDGSNICWKVRDFFYQIFFITIPENSSCL
jgi:hypothetical protein